MIKLRLSRAGSKKRPYYHIVVADVRAPRDGKFIEQVGTYNPMVAKDHADRLKLNADRIAHWLKEGAQPTDRVAKFLAMNKMGEKVAVPTQTKQHLPKTKAQERLKAIAEKNKAAEEVKKKAAADAKAESEKPIEVVEAPVEAIESAKVVEAPIECAVEEAEKPAETE